MKKIALATAALLIASGAAYAQKAPVQQTGNLDASTSTQIKQTEGATKPGSANIDFSTTQSTSGASSMSKEPGVPAFRDPGNLDANTKDNLQGR